MVHSLRKLALGVGLLGLLVLSAGAEEKAPSAAEAQFQRAFYLQAHQHDAAGAVAAYEKVAADLAAPEKLRIEANARLAALREDLASANFASLMPADVMGYAEIVQPGEHIGRILKLMGLAEPADSAGDKPTKEQAIPLGNGLSIPADFTVSPALIAELSKIRGVAAGVTAIDDRGRPAGLLVIHPGDCDLVRGAIETGVQILEPGEPIGKFKTYRIPEIGWVTLTARLVLVSDAREQIAAAIERLQNPKAENLATRPEFKRVQLEAQGSLLFAYVDGPQIVKRYGSQLKGQEAAMIRGLLDLDHFESLVLSLTTTDAGIRLQAQMNLAPGHRNMVYALIRTAPITRRSLAQVPRGSAGVVVIGLNPAGPPTVAANSRPTNQPNISAMDIGREFFGNIEELAAFALPPVESSGTAPPLPEIGVAIAVKDPEKSEALWNQILSLATLFGARTEQPRTTVEIEGQSAQLYRFAGVPPIAVARARDRGLIIGTQGAVGASLRAGLKNESILQDEQFAPLLARLTPDTSKAVLVDVGRGVEIAAALSPGREAQQLKAASTLMRDLKVSIMTDEAPNQLTIRSDITGLPNFRAIVALINAQH